VAVKWVIDEDLTDHARALLQDSRTNLRPLVGPPLLTAEVVSIVYQRLRSRDPERHLPEDEARQVLVAFLSIPMQLLAPKDLYQRAFDLARNHGLTNTYDSLYVALAEMLGAEMWTDDQDLLRTLGSSTPWVRSIRDYPLPKLFGAADNLA
jgi:predicted nucleic acid-binding protein